MLFLSYLYPLAAERPVQGSQRFCRNLEEFCPLQPVILSNFAMSQDLWRSGFPCGGRMDPLHILNPSNNPDLLVNTATENLPQLTNRVSDTARFCLSFALESTVGWKSTLAYETITNCWPGRFSAAYCTHIFQT